MNREALRALLIKHEGISLKPYQDTVGKLTIGVGRNLDDVGLTEQEALDLLDNDIAKVLTYCREAFSWFNILCDARQNVVASMIFNMGAANFAQFKKMIASIEKSDFKDAANEMLCSKWAAQVGARATELAVMMENGDPLH
jgi:lysozyme